VIRGHHVVEHAQAKALLCLEKPLEITAAVPGKLEQEFLLVAAVRNMPNTSRNVMPICPRHSIEPFLESPFCGQKYHPKPQNRVLCASLSQNFIGLSWSDPRQVLFVPGFFGVSEAGDITTFGRGGSDYSAAVVAADPRSNTRSSRPCPTFKLTCAVPKKHVKPQSFSASRAAIGSPGLQCLSDLRGITAQVQNSPHYNNRFLLKLVIDRVRKSLGQHPMIAEKLWMDATIQRQRINIGK